jgi:hypothetical protein
MTTEPDEHIVHDLAQKVADIALHDAVHVDQWISAVVNAELSNECKLTRVKYHTAVERRMSVVKPAWLDERPAPAQPPANNDEREAVEAVRDWIADLDGEAVVEFKVHKLRAVLDQLQRLEQALVEPDSLAKATLVQGVKPWTSIDDVPTADLTPEESASFDASLSSLREDPQADEIERLRAEVRRLDQEREAADGFVAVLVDTAGAQHEVDEIRCQACRAYMGGPLKSPTTLAARDGRESDR